MGTTPSGRAGLRAPVTVTLTGERARHLAERLLGSAAAPPWADGGAPDLSALAPAARVAHDWDPATGRLVLAGR